MEMGTIVREQTRARDKSGLIHGQSQSRTTGIPPRLPTFGSPIPLLQRTGIRDIRARGAQDHDAPAQNHDHTRRNNEISIAAGLSADDGSLYTASDIPITNAKRLQKAFEKVTIWAGQNGLKPDMNKVTTCASHDCTRERSP